VSLRAAAFGLLFGTVTLAAAPRSQGPPQQPPVFRGGAETVPIYTTVLDRYGEIVRNLTRDDFEVLDNGQPQELTVFQAGLQPISAAVMVDTSASMTLNLRLALSAADGSCGCCPVIRPVSGPATGGLSADFTGDRDAAPRVGTCTSPARRSLGCGRCDHLRAGLGGRRVLLLLTDGMDTASTAMPDGVLARSRANEVMVYVVQFRSSPQANLAEFSLAPSASQLFGNDEARRARISPTYVNRLARQSGGGHFILGQFDDVNATFSQVMQELHYQYVLGFTPQVQDGSYTRSRSASARRT
jgi:Ca-activated chloride channel family protein